MDSEKQATNLLLAGGGTPAMPGVTDYGATHRALRELESWVSMALYKIQYFFVLPWLEQ